MSGDPPPSDDMPRELSAVDLDDADRARIEYLSRDGVDIDATEAERIVRFARLPRDDRTPSMLRIAGVDDTASDADLRGDTDTTTNGSDDDTTDVCAAIRRRMRDATRVATVVDDYPDTHPSAIFRHAEGRCTCDTDVPPTTSPRVQSGECHDMRVAFRQGATKRDVMADFHRSANAVNKHLFGRCFHPATRDGSVFLSTSECGHLRDAYSRNDGVSVRDVASAFGVSTSTAYQHLAGACTHDVDVSPPELALPNDSDDHPGRVTAAVCESMRSDYRAAASPVVAEIARDHHTTRPTADYHIFGRCDHDVGEPPADR